MSTKDLVNAIIVGDAVEIENAFQATMAEKISARLDDYRQEVAQTMFAIEEVELSEGTLMVSRHRNYARPGQGPEAHPITKDHGKAPDGSRVYSVKQPNGFHGVLAVKGDTVVGSSSNNLSKDEAHSLGAHYAKHGAVGIGGGKHWSLGSGIHGKVVKESIELDEAISDDDKASAALRATVAKQKLKQIEKSGKHKSPALIKKLQSKVDAAKSLNKEEVEEILASEEFAQLDELSKTTLGNYIKKASGGVKGAMAHAYVAGGGTGASEEGKKKSFDIAQKRLKGVRTAVDKLAKEDVEQLVVTTVESALYAMQDGRNVLDEQIDEAVSSSSKDNYEWTHGNKPKGHGNWFFSTVHPRQHDMQQHKDQTVNVTGTFGDAAKKAQAHFKEKGHKGEIHVLT